VNKILAALFLAAIAVAPVAAETAPAPAPSAVVATKGKVLIDSKGSRLGSVIDTLQDGSAQILLDGRMITVPVSTLSIVDGKLTTSLKKADVLNLP
jgi:hypothetical protein